MRVYKATNGLGYFVSPQIDSDHFPALQDLISAQKEGLYRRSDQYIWRARAPIPRTSSTESTQAPSARQPSLQDLPKRSPPNLSLPIPSRGSSPQQSPSSQHQSVHQSPPHQWSARHTSGSSTQQHVDESAPSEPPYVVLGSLRDKVHLLNGAEGTFPLLITPQAELFMEPTDTISAQLIGGPRRWVVLITRRLSASSATPYALDCQLTHLKNPHGRLEALRGQRRIAQARLRIQDDHWLLECGVDDLSDISTRQPPMRRRLKAAKDDLAFLIEKKRQAALKRVRKGLACEPFQEPTPAMLEGAIKC